MALKVFGERQSQNGEPNDQSVFGAKQVIQIPRVYQ